MSNSVRVSLLLLVVLAGVSLAWGLVRAAPPAIPPAPEIQVVAQPTPARLPDHPAVENPDISFIDSPTAECVLPRPGTDACYVSWYYLYVDASPNYMISSTVAIDGQIRGSYHGFFQTSMFVPSEMLTFRVSCGVPGAGGRPDFGMSHSYTLRARASDGLGSANYGSVYCPADQVPLSDPTLAGSSSAKVYQFRTFLASAFPITATQPITYEWNVTGLGPFTEVGGVTRSHDFAWAEPGIKTIQVTISNPVSSFVRTRTIRVDPYRVYLPYARKH